MSFFHQWQPRLRWSSLAESLSGRSPEWRPSECIGPFSVSEEGRKAANRLLIEALDSPACGLILDEIGSLELIGGGLAEAVYSVLQDGSPAA